MLFSVIVGNPPYQGTKKTGGSKGKPPTIWPKFVEKCNDLLKPDGMMILVHPAMYRKPGNALQSILYYNNRKLCMFNNAEAGVTFNVSSRYDWYVIDKTYTGPTDVTFEDETTHSIDLTQTPFLPNGSITIWDKCHALVAKVGALHTKKECVSPSGVGDYNVVQTVTPTKGIVIRKTDKLPKAYHTNKVIIGESGGIGMYDPGELGMSTNCYYVDVESEEEGLAIVNFIQSKLGQHLIASVKWGNFRTECVLWHYVPNPYKLGVKPDSTDTDIFEAYNLTQDEIKFINTYQYGKCRSKLHE